MQPSATILDRDQPCLRCAYSLRGLPTASDCPECGAPIALSLRSDMLAHSDPAYVRRLERGAALSFWAPVAAACVTALLIAISAAWPDVTAGIEGVVDVLLTGPFFLGWWLLTAPDPARNASHDGERPRRAVRAFTLALPVLLIFAVGAEMIRPETLRLHVVLGGLQSFLLYALVIAAMLYLRRLAPRIPQQVVFRRARTLGTLFMVGAALQPFLTVHHYYYVGWIMDQVAAAAPAGLTHPMSIAIAVTTGISVLFSLFLVVVYTILCFKLWRSLRTAHAESLAVFASPRPA
jgi:hypothetical protein